MICSRRLYKGNSYEICLPLPDTGVTMVRFYTRGDVVVEKEPEITADTMCFELTKTELDILPDGVLRYEVVTEYETTDTNSPYVIVTPADYDAKTLDELLAEAYQTGYNDGLDNCDFEPAYNSGYTDGYNSGYTDGYGSGCSVCYNSGYTEGYDSGYTDGYDSGYTEGYDSGYTDGANWCGRDYSKECFTIRTNVDGVMTIPIHARYRINCGEWSTPNDTGTTTIEVSKRDAVEFKSALPYAGMFKDVPMPDDFEVYGNIRSLQSGDSFLSANTSHIYVPDMFMNCSGITSAENLVLPHTATTVSSYAWMFQNCPNLVHGPKSLPATSLATDCYKGMFLGCRKLETAPTVLPATELAVGCYHSMFWCCESLTTAPAICATTLANSCCAEMFDGCTNLTTAPELLATGLTYSCYLSMFDGCENLKYVKCLATDLSASYCTQHFLMNASQTGTFVKACGAEWPTGRDGIPTGWTVEEEGCPDYSEDYFTLKVNTSGEVIIQNDYQDRNMDVQYSVNDGAWQSINFGDYTEFNQTYWCLIYSLGQFQAGDEIRFKAGGAKNRYDLFWGWPFLSTGVTSDFEVYGNIMSLIYGDNFTGQTALTKMNQFSSMFMYDSGLTDASNLILPATTLKVACYQAMFEGTRITKAPELPATTISPQAYDSMFRDCTTINYVKCLAVESPREGNYGDGTIVGSCDSWLNSAPATGTFIKNPQTPISDWNGGIPSGWTVVDSQ